MNVGILSMQKVMNYGSFLQAFALRKFIEQIDNYVEYIDIHRGTVFPELKPTFLFLINKAVERYAHRDALKRLRMTKGYRQRFAHEFFELLGTEKHTLTHFDTVVIGSDEVFNFAQKVPWGYTPQLYGKVENADLVISYAGSFGHTTLEDIRHYGVEQEIASAMNSMAAISVRDMNSYEIVKALTGKEPFIHVDPVLMFDFSSYIKPCNRKDYIIIYSYPNRIKDKREVEAIRAFAKKHGKKLISIGFYFSWCDETVIPDPFEVLGYIQGADYVITDTFHGSVMSLKFGRQFAALVRPSNRQKMTSLLDQFHLRKRIVSDINCLEDTLLAKSDYNKVNEILAQEQERSMQYLSEHLTKKAINIL